MPSQQSEICCDEFRISNTYWPLNLCRIWIDTEAEINGYFDPENMDTCIDDTACSANVIMSEKNQVERLDTIFLATFPPA